MNFDDMLTVLQLTAKTNANGTKTITERKSNLYVGRLVPLAGGWEPWLGIGSRERKLQARSCPSHLSVGRARADLTDALLDLMAASDGATVTKVWTCTWCGDDFVVGVRWAGKDTGLDRPCCSAAHAEHVNGEWDRFAPKEAS